jgi:hypothetical protein
MLELPQSIQIDCYGQEKTMDKIVGIMEEFKCHTIPQVPDEMYEEE